ncbi:MAG: hypothetical protein LBR51_01835 [Bacteroidales bacterium]|jgi:hypothetical protein|nr:hypothetical protein [Bacteroidales bacterium]
MLNHRGHDKIMSRHCGLNPQSPALSASSRLRGHDGTNLDNQENLVKTCIEQSRNIVVQTIPKFRI